MQKDNRPAFARGFSSAQAPMDTSSDSKTPTVQAPLPRPPKSMHVKRVTLTSKKNWWMGTLRTIVLYSMPTDKWDSGDGRGGEQPAIAVLC